MRLRPAPGGFPTGPQVYAVLIEDALLSMPVVVLGHYQHWPYLYWWALLPLWVVGSRVVRLWKAMTNLIEVRKNPMLNYMYLVKKEFGG